MADEDDEFTMETTVEGGQTVIEITGQRDVAVVVRNTDETERIYLPPEGFDQAGGDASRSDSPYQRSDSPYQRSDSPYQRSDSPYQRSDSPYQRSDSPYQRSDSPYQSAPDDTPYESARTVSRRRGASLTADGVRIVHPGTVDEVQLFR